MRNFLSSRSNESVLSQFLETGSEPITSIIVGYVHYALTSFGNRPLEVYIVSDLVSQVRGQSVELCKLVELFHSLTVAETRRVYVLNKLIDVAVNARKEYAANNKDDNGKDALAKRIYNERYLRVVDEALPSLVCHRSFQIGHD
jgi:hypothetical protein